MTEKRKKLIDRLQSWLDTDPRKQIVAAVCANIAEEYAEEQLLLHNVSQQSIEGFVDWFNTNDKTQSILSERIEEYLKTL
tara:strand:- start:13 stop:252 length:240 start_codon:yes stop_codon:yes gene_type:complete